jgi:hypothetical protein
MKVRADVADVTGNDMWNALSNFRERRHYPLVTAKCQLLLKYPDYTQNPAKIYDFRNCKATATANKRRKLVLTPGCANNLAISIFERRHLSQS